MAAFEPVDVRFMRRALRLATLSLGRTWPNPGVGCVIARRGEVIGEGRHAVYGQAHAEVNALAQCSALGHDPAGATVYVTLSPCTRHGRQPPCIDALRSARVARVVAAIDDPHQDLAALALAEAGIAYQAGCCAAEATQLHGGFLARVTRNRPRLTGKWAMTLDGSIATRTRDSAWISSVEALAFSRRRRRLFDAIMIGAGTAHQDDPSLLSAQVGERTPVRVVISRGAELPEHSLLVATKPKASVMVLHAPDAPAGNLAALRSHGVEVHAVEDPHQPLQVARVLGECGFNDVLVEGGAQVHGAFLRAHLYDRLELYIGASTIAGGLGVCAGSGADLMRDAHHWMH
jgi:diaminohydroxyphosphoribosylaminopyrimidine deaminase/5-amino-6-(5-phosphoribosylamino)uracil reductase